MQLNELLNNPLMDKPKKRKTRLSRKGKGRGSTIIITHNGKTQSLAEWSKELDIPSGTLCYRYNQGWNPEKILSKEDFQTKARKENKLIWG